MEKEERAQDGGTGQGRKGKGVEGRTGAPFNFLPPGAADVVMPLHSRLCPSPAEFRWPLELNWLWRLNLDFSSTQLN